MGVNRPNICGPEILVNPIFIYSDFFPENEQIIQK